MIIITANETQSKQILEHLQKCGKLTPLEALKLYGCLRLAPRICDLRKKGYIISFYGIQSVVFQAISFRTFYIKRNGKRFALYVYEGHENEKR